MRRQKKVPDTFDLVNPLSINTQDPQSLHKYLYCHTNPVNGIDPSGRSIAFSIQDVTKALTIGLLLVATTIVATNPVWREANECVTEAVIASTIALVAAIQMPFKDGWRWIKEKWESVIQYLKDRDGLYLHYSYRIHAWKMLSGLLPGSYVTRGIYPTGKLAQKALNLYHHPKPPNAVYVVWPRKGYGPTFQWPVPGGSGYEYVLGKGSGGPGTVFGPIRIPEDI